MKKKDLFDFSDFFDPVKKQFIVKMKDKLKGKIIGEFVRWKSKMYFLIDVDNQENKKAKGINKNVVQNIIHKKLCI